MAIAGMKYLADLPRIRFSLASLFVVITIIGVCFYYPVKLVVDRRAALAWVTQNGGGVVSVQDAVMNAGHWGPGYLPPKIPLWRRFIGDEAIPTIVLPRNCPAEKKKGLQDLFPEAELWNRE